MWALIAEVGIWAGLYIANKLLAPKPQLPKPLGRDNLTLPRTDIGTPVPLVFGRTRVTAPILAWTGELTHQTFAINGGYSINYGLDMLFIVGIPMTGAPTMFSNLGRDTPLFYGAWYGEKKLPMNQPLPNSGYSGTQVMHGQTVVRNGFLGGPGQGGGLIGEMHWYHGAPDNDLTGTVNGPYPTRIGDLLTTYLMGNADMVPGYRNMMAVAFVGYGGDEQNNQVVGGNIHPHVQFDGGIDASGTHPNNFTIGESPNVEGVSFEVGTYGSFDPTITTMTEPGYDFGGGADPVEVIYDLLTAPLGKIGLPSSKINKPSFLAASAVLKAEGHGYSNTVYETTEGTAAINAVLQQIDAALYEEPSTGQLTLKLIRNDYNIVDLQVFDASNIIDIEDYGIGGWPDLITEVRVNFRNQDLEYQDDIAVAQSLANANANGNRRNTKTIDYPGITNSTLAASVAARDLNAFSRPLKKLSIIVNRDGYALRPGTCFIVNYPEYGINNRVFRAQRVDQGQLFDGKVTLDAVDDVFASTYAGQIYLFVTGTVFVPPPYPFAYQYVSECPWWIAHRMHEVGMIGNGENMPRLFAVAAPSINAKRMALTSRQVIPNVSDDPSAPQGGISAGIGGMMLPDAPIFDIPISFTLLNAVTRDSEPYDTTTGLAVTGVTSPQYAIADIIAQLTVTKVPTDIAQHGANLIAIVDDDGSLEFMAFESAAYISGTDFTFTKVWRGLLDTPAQSHKAGARGYFVSPSSGGRRGYSIFSTVDYTVVPSSALVSGSGIDPRGEMSIAGRAVAPLPPADLKLGGERMTGSIGRPSASDRYKIVSQFEEGIEVYGAIRDRQSPSIARGTDSDQVNTDTTAPFFTFVAAPVNLGALYYQTQGAYSGIAQNQAGTGNGDIQSSVLIDGFGAMQFAVGASRNVAVNDSVISIGGLVPNQSLKSKHRATIAIQAYEWRNMIANVRFSSVITAAWTATNLSVQTGSFGVSKMATAKYVQPSATSATLVQAPNYGDYMASKMSAIVFGYYRQANSDANDTVQLRADIMQGGVSQANATSTVTPVAAAWGYREVAVTVPDISAVAGVPFDQVKLTNTFTEVATGGTTNADVCASELGMSLGQIYNGTNNLLTNPSFEAGTTTGWTVSSGAFSVASTIASPSANYLQGGAFASNVIFQEFALPAGYEINTWAVARIWRAQTLANDTGSLKLEAMDGSSTVLATAVEGGASPLLTLNEWYEKIIALKISVSGATKVRVTFTATRTLGSGVSGACVDEVRFGLHKCLDNSFQPNGGPVVADWGTYLQPQKLPASWQAFGYAFPTLPQPSFVFGEGNTGLGNELTRRDQHVEWSDQAVHLGQTVKGHFDGAYNAYGFVRGSGASSLCMQAIGASIGQIAAYNKNHSFTVVVGFIVDELAFAGDCGLAGRRDLTAGWSLGINASGHVEATIHANDGTFKTVASTITVTEGGFHLAAIAYDAIAGILYVYADSDFASVSTSGLGEFARNAATCRFRIGKSSDFSDTLGGRIARVYTFDSLVSFIDFSRTLYTYNTVSPLEPLDEISNAWVYDRDSIVWGCPGPDVVDVAPLCAYPLATDFPYVVEAGCAGIGFAGGHTNVIPTWDLQTLSIGACWALDAGASATYGIVDNTGAALGAKIVTNSTNGIYVQGITGGAHATWTFVFWATSTLGVALTAELQNASGIVKNTQAVAVAAVGPSTPGFQRYVVKFSGWDNSTPTMIVRLRATSTSGTFTLGHVTWMAFGTEVALLYPPPLSSVSDITASRIDSYGRGFNSEGELVARIAMAQDVPPNTYQLLNMVNGIDNKNRREVFIASGGAVTLNHYDGVTPTNATTTTTALTDWNTNGVHDIRARWNRAGLLDPGTSPFASVIAGTPFVAGSVRANARSAVWTDSLTQNTEIDVNFGSAGGGHFVLSQLQVSSRELVSWAASLLI